MKVMLYHLHDFMKKIIIIVCIIFGLSLSLLNLINQPTSAQKLLKETAEETRNPSHEAKIDSPIHIKIPKLQINAYVEHVGKDEEDRMDVPSDFLNAAWYSLGPRPGEIGNSVIAAHFDNPDGTPSVFYDIEDLNKADEIIINDSSNNVLVFRVINTELFETEKFPIKLVFGKNSKRMLNLITCAGEFDDRSDNYSQRTVVFSELHSINGKQIQYPEK